MSWSFLLSILAGHNRYAHITSLMGESVNTKLLGMTKVVMGLPVLKSDALISIPDKTVYRVRADGDIMWRKTAHKNRLIGRPGPYVAQVVGNRLAGS